MDPLEAFHFLISSQREPVVAVWDKHQQLQAKRSMNWKSKSVITSAATSSCLLGSTRALNPCLQTAASRTNRPLRNKHRTTILSSRSERSQYLRLDPLLPDPPSQSIGSGESATRSTHAKMLNLSFRVCSKERTSVQRSSGSSESLFRTDSDNPDI